MSDTVIDFEEILDVIKSEIKEKITTEETIMEIKPETADKLNTTTKQMTLEELKSKFVFSDKTFELLELGFNTGNNIFNWGPGGFGKSEITQTFFKNKGIEPYIMTLGSGSTTERLFGGIDLVKFKDQGVIEYLVENSFMNYEYVIFEEMLDAPSDVLEQLKDILSSKVFRNGTQVFPIKTKMIVCNTNTNRDDWAKTSSLKALMERFPLSLKVEWKTYDQNAYNKLYNTVFGPGVIDPFLTFILEQYHKANKTISPRIAIKAAELFLSCGLDCLDFIAEFQKDKDIIQKAKVNFAGQKAIVDFKNKIDKEIDIISKQIIDNEDTETILAKIEALMVEMSQINKIKLEEDLVARRKEIVDYYEKQLKLKKDILESKKTFESLNLDLNDNLQSLF